MGSNRQTRSQQIRQEVAQLRFARQHPEHRTNADGGRYKGRVATYTKGLPHHDKDNFPAGIVKGEVQEDAYATLSRALCSKDPRDFEAITLKGGRKLVSPQAGLAFDLVGVDAGAVTVPPHPSLDSEELASEMVELYWMALLRDVPFTEYGSHPDAGAAAAELDGMSGFADLERITIKNLFRGSTPGDLRGPYLSQFLLHPVQFGTLRFDQTQTTKKPGTDYLIEEKEFLEVQDGKPFSRAETNPEADLDKSSRFYIRNMRDLAHYVHFDALYEAYLNACLILLDIEAPLDPGNPYVRSQTQEGFATWGGPHILSLVTEVATRALKAVWHQKWFVHTRARPEAIGYLVHRAKTKSALTKRYDFLPDSLLNSDAVARVGAKNGGRFLLPQAFPEGSPTHPAYGAGHATVAGACVTILKAWFDEGHEAFVPSPKASRHQLQVMVASATEDKLLPGPKETLRVGDELDKLAANIAIGRNGGGVHYRSDYSASIRLGEQIAISTLEDQLATYNESATLSFTNFDGQMVRIG